MCVITLVNSWFFLSPFLKHSFSRRPIKQPIFFFKRDPRRRKKQHMGTKTIQKKKCVFIFVFVFFPARSFSRDTFCTRTFHSQTSMALPEKPDGEQQQQQQQQQQSQERHHALVCGCTHGEMAFPSPSSPLLPVLI